MDKVKSVLTICLVLGLFLGQTDCQPPEYRVCLRQCLKECFDQPGSNWRLCSIKCQDKCADPPSLGDPLSFCKLGCAYSLCDNLGSRGDPGEEKVEGCMDSCWGTCTKGMEQAL